MFLFFGSEFIWSSTEEEVGKRGNRQTAWNLVHAESEIYPHALKDLVLAALYGLFDARMAEILGGIENKNAGQAIDYFSRHQDQWQTSEHIRMEVYKGIANQLDDQSLLGDLWKQDTDFKENIERLRHVIEEVQ